MASETDPSQTHKPVNSDPLKAELADSATHAVAPGRPARASFHPFSSIRAKLGIFAVLEVALISAALYVFFPSHLEDQAVDAITKRASAVADMAAYVISGRASPQSSSDVDILLRASAQVEDLVYVFLTGPDGTVISEVNRDPGRYLANSEIRKPGGLSPQHDIFRVHRAVEVADGSRRTLHLAISLEPLTKTARRSRATIAGICMLILMLGMVGVVIMSQIITAPLKEIVATAEKISQGELEHRVKVASVDEIGRLGASFNNMVDGLKSAYKHLESANATLAYHSEDLQAEIAQKKRAEEALRASEAKFRAVVEHATDVVAVLNESGRIRYVSPATIHMMGVPPENLVGTKVLDNVHPEDRPVLQRALNQSKSLTGIIEADVRWRHANGKWRYLAFRGRNLADLPGIEGLLFNVTDVTEAKHFQTELVLAKEKAEEMVALKDSFLTNMSHEIRTPLTGILGFAQILKTEVDDDKFELVDHIQRSGQRLLNTLNAVLDLAELEALSARPELERVAVGHEIR
ncbi:MAG: PAS domain S-box protein, partial [Rhodothermia bacterium]|nr:PAS domain S-box protein [Rhodothermia bacterium]